jgi:hypothetical protein
MYKKTNNSKKVTFVNKMKILRAGFFVGVGVTCNSYRQLIDYGGGSE